MRSGERLRCVVNQAIGKHDGANIALWYNWKGNSLLPGDMVLHLSILSQEVRKHYGYH